MYESTAEMIQTMLWIRRTGMPSNDARSERSAEARIALPNAPKRRKNASAISTIGAMMMISTSSPAKFVWPTANDAVIGGLKNVAVPVPNATLRPRAAATRSCWMPVVATVRISRGEFRKRRMNTNSIVRPTKTAASSPVITAR